MTVVALHAAPELRPLADERVRATVVAAAEALGERMGVPCRIVEVDDRSVSIDVEAPGVAALGFAAELRRTTNEWAVGRGLGLLWPNDPAPSDDDAFQPRGGDDDEPGGPVDPGA